MSLPDTFGIVNANANVKRVHEMLFKVLKYFLPKRMRLLPFVLNTIPRIEVEAQVSLLLDNFKAYPYFKYSSTP